MEDKDFFHTMNMSNGRHSSLQLIQLRFGFHRAADSLTPISTMGAQLGAPIKPRSAVMYGGCL